MRHYLAFMALLLLISAGSAYYWNIGGVDYASRVQVNASATSGFAGTPYKPLVINSSNVNYSLIASNSYALAYENNTPIYTYTFGTGMFVWNASGNSYIWYKAGNATYYLYFNNKSVVPTTYFNPYMVFPMYDNFDGTSLNTSNFAGSSATLEIGSGFVHVSDSDGGAYQGISSVNTLNSNSVLYFRANFSGGSRENAMVGYATTMTAPMEVLIHHDGGSKYRYGTSGIDGTVTLSTWTIVDAPTMGDYSIRRTGAAFYLYRAGAIDASQQTSGAPTASITAAIGASGNGHVGVDYIFGTNYTSGIAYSLGAIENAPTAPIITINSPGNANYSQWNLPLNFSATSGSDSYFELTALLNGTQIYHDDSYPTGTNIVVDHITDGKYNLTIIANDSNGGAESSVLFYHKLANITGSSTITNPLITQTVNFTLFIKNYTNIYFTFYNPQPGVLINVTFNFNGTNYTPIATGQSGDSSNYSAMILMPTSAGDYNLTATASFTYGKNATFAGNITYETFIYPVSLTAISVNNCTSGVPSVIFNAKSEENESILSDSTLNYKTIVTYWIGQTLFNYSFTWTNVNYSQLCISPNYSSMNASVELTITKAGLTQRTNFLVNATLTNVTQNVTTYMALNNSQLVNFKVVDAFQNSVSDVYIKIQRYYTSQTAWIDVTTIRSDGLGNAPVWLVPNTEQYKLLLYQNGMLVKTYNPMYITQSTYTLQLTNNGGADNQRIVNGIYTNCSWNSATLVFSCIASDASGLMSSARLVVLENKLFSASTYCDSTATGSAVTIPCDLHSYTNATSSFNYQFYVTINGVSYLRMADSILGVPSTNSFGLTGVFASFMIFLAVSLIGIWNPGASILLGFISLVVCATTGLLSVPTVGLTSLGVVVAILLYKLRT